jgi:hypothetical protein
MFKKPVSNKSAEEGYKDADYPVRMIGQIRGEASDKCR